MRVKISLILLIVFFVACSHKPKVNQEEPSIHSPAEIYKIMEQSKVTYNIEIVENLDKEKADTIQLHNQFYTIEDEDKIDLYVYKLKNELFDSLEKAEKLFQLRELEDAKKLYEYIYKKDPTYHHALTLIGDVYYLQNNYEKAKYYFKKAIEKNFVDYNAHWFLADTYWNEGNIDEAVNEIIIAHILNINHGKLKERMIKYKNESENSYKNWSFDPTYSVEKVDKKVKIKFEQEWMGYAFVKAVWLFEPGHSEKMIGRQKQVDEFSTIEEREAILSYLVTNKDKQPINKIIEDGYLNEFILYEIIGKNQPASILLLGKDWQIRIADYVKKYH